MSENLQGPQNMGITPEPGTLVAGSSNALLVITPLYRHLLDDARRQAASGSYQLAVILAHAACDVATGAILTRLIHLRGAGHLGDFIVSSLRSGAALDDSRTKRLWRELTDDYPAGHRELNRERAEWWDAWIRGRELRHKVAHAGRSASAEQTSECLDSAHSYIIHMATIEQRVEQSLVA
jgi:hypothetical protein